MMTTFAWGAALMTAAGALAIQQVPGGQPTIRTSIDVVTIDAWVHDEGHAIAGLTAGDFIVLDNGVPRDVTVTATGSTHLIVVLDVSGSVAGGVSQDLRAAIARVVPMLTDDDRVSLVTFGDRVRIHAVAEPPSRLAGHHLDRLTSSGSTTLHDAVLVGSQLARADSRPAVLLLFTDGADTASWTSAGRVVDAVRQTPVVVYVVGATLPLVQPSPPDAPYFSAWSWRSPTFGDALRFLLLLADTTGGEFVRLEQRTELDRAFTGVVERYRQRYLLSFALPPASAPGWHRLEVRLREKRGAVVARQGYVAP